MLTQGLTPSDVINSLKAGNLDLPAGRLERGAKETLIRVVGRFRQVRDFEGLPVRAVNGTVVRLGDVATIKDGAEERRSTSLLAEGQGAAMKARTAVAGATIPVMTLGSAGFRVADEPPSGYLLIGDAASTPSGCLVLGSAALMRWRSRAESPAPITSDNTCSA